LRRRFVLGIIVLAVDRLLTNCDFPPPAKPAMPTYKLHAPEASFRAFATLIAAEYNGVSIDVSTDLAAASKSPVGKLPILELPDGNVIFSSHAMARFVAGLRRDSGLMGSTLAEASAIDAWMDWAAQDLELPATVWFYPVAGYIPFNQAA
jgi:elongation factor 1-gamma